MKTAIRNGYTPKTGDYCEMIVVDKENQSAYIFDCDGVFTPMPQPIDVERILEEAAAYTDEAIEPLKEKLDTIEEGAQENVIEVVQKNGTPLTITNKTVNVTVPTKTSDLENDSGFIDDLSNYYTKTEVDQEIGTEESARILADNNLQSQIDAITAGSDVVDIVGTKADLDDYDTSGLSANDIIKVLTDETQDDATTYYRWTGSVWQYIGAEGPFYTKSEADSTFVPQTRTINSKALTTNITLTAQDVGALPDSTVIPTVNDATLTIQQNGSTLDTFTANSSTNKTVNITTPTVTSDLTNDSGFITSADIPTDVSSFVNDAGYLTSVSWTDIINRPTNVSDFMNDAGYLTSVSWTDIIDRPTIPTVNDATLTIQKNGTNVATFTANSSTNQTANITVPVNTSELINDSGFLTSAALSNYYTKSETYTQGEVNSLINSIAVPTKTSDLTNDGADGTSTYVETAEIAPSTLVVEYSSGYTQYYNPLDGNNTYIAITNNAFSGASASIGGRAGLVPAPSAGDQDKYLKGDGTWATVQGGGGTTTVFYVDINDFITYTSNTITLYTDDTLTTAVTPSQLATAYAAGDVVIGCIDNSIQEGAITIIARLEDQYSSGFVEYTAVSYSWTDDGNGNMTSQANIFVITADENTNSPQMGFIVSRVQDKLTAGNNISISSNNTISASIPIDSALDVSSSNPVENSVVTAAINNKADASDLADYVTLATTQNITGEKTFVGDKRIKFKGVNSSSKLGFTMYDQNNAELGFLEATGQGNASKKNLLGIYDNSGSATRTNYLGFQYYNTHPTSGSTVAYSLVAPPLYRGVTSVNSYAYIPVEFTDGNATVKAGTDGIVDLSTIMPASQDALIIREWS